MAPEYPVPNQGSTCGDPSEIECPHCGRANELDSSEEILKGERIECGHCDGTFEIACVDYSVTVWTKAVPREPR